jgi:transcriptional regulator with XRE-family HTH domain
VTPAQCRAARGLINMSMAQLAAAAVVPVVVIYDFEAGFGKPKAEDLTAMQAALERAGVEFIDGGVKLRKEKP